MNLLLLTLGGAFGAVSRYMVGIVIMRAFPNPPIPVAMVSVNFLGSLGLGCFLGLYFGSIPFDAYAYPLFLLLGVGFFGAFTTFSTFSVEAVQLIRDKQPAKALLYISASILGSIALFLLGFSLSLTD
ncbi:CrcB protein [Caldalkalibacillus uzonensis]|uniref:Fluoride-specific ion channel FluC n=1 Tax=Caldalkalibacillus uzonensis TaxID=353224 RepID=A0ABU0CTH6_9BACI|nr:fluoride efflux transporter CrcB [Caldalkalibacillus uzonensis]MDQ0339727.1 CrcB protein [Caldalkalibacillus uzonensis]